MKIVAAGPVIPLSRAADAMLARLARATASAAIAALDGGTLLGERAILIGASIPGRISAGGACRLIAARDDFVALNLARPSDRELMPALFEDAALDPDDDAAIAHRVGNREAAALVARGRTMGLPIATMRECRPARPQSHSLLCPGLAFVGTRRGRPRVLDLSALWAGPLAAHLLWLAGAEVIKVESTQRPDAMRDGQPAFHALLNQGKQSVALDLRDVADRQALLALIMDADIVIEAARPRALAQLGIDAAAIVAATPGLVWLTITAHGTTGEAANWVGFGDDVGVAAGLSAELYDATGGVGFVGDAIADPLTGIRAAEVGWQMWRGGSGGRFGIAMRDVAAICAAYERERDPLAWRRTLVYWTAGEGGCFPHHRPRSSVPAATLGSGPGRWTAIAARC